jgi:flagellar biosynthetic protein FliR
MIAIPEAFVDLVTSGFWLFAAVFLRVSTLVSVLPAFGERSVPARVKLILAFAFCAIVVPAVPVFDHPTTPGGFAKFAVTEAIVGLALGIGLRLFVLALQTAGAIAAQSTSLSQILGGAAADPIPAMGYILVVAGLALAVMAGLHVRAAELLILSYDVFPAGQFPDAQSLSAWGLAQVSQAFALAFTLAAPFVIASVIYNLALGAINRAMPQLMVAFVGAPVITMGGLVLLFLIAPVLLSVWLEALMTFAANPMSTTR